MIIVMNLLSAFSFAGASSFEMSDFPFVVAILSSRRKEFRLCFETCSSTP